MNARYFEGSGPILKPEIYFAGRTEAWGMVQDRFGRIRRSFDVVMEGEWDGGVLTLEEHFTYDDGARETRTWRVAKLGEGDYEGRADDVVGTAKGQAFGRALNWHYDLRLPIAGREWIVRFDDLMLLQDENRLLNVAEMSKFGLTIGRLTLTFQKLRD
jgi:hypothetical protein